MWPSGPAGQTRLCRRRRPRPARPARPIARAHPPRHRRAAPGKGADRIPRRPDRPRAGLGAGGRAAAHLPASTGCARFSCSATTRRCCFGILAGEAQLIPGWLRFGGAQCLKSYGGDPRQDRRCSETRRRWRRSARRSRPSIVEFLGSFADTCRFGDYLFVHAGIRPGVELDQQTPADLRWIREPFLRDDTRSRVRGRSWAYHPARDRGAAQPHRHRHRSLCDREC